MNEQNQKPNLEVDIDFKDGNSIKSYYVDGELVIESSINDTTKNSRRIISTMKSLKKSEELQKKLEASELKKKKIEEQVARLKVQDFFSSKQEALKNTWETYRKENKGASDLVLLEGFIKSSGIRKVLISEKETKKK